ncbi:MAG: efflux RND transporter periplasmic adaptor subunit [Alphaproteobacteria bacterium]
MPVATVAAVETDVLTRERRYTGLVVPRRSVDLAFQVGGLVDRVEADLGDSIDRGRVVATLDRRRALARQAEIEAGIREVDATIAFAAAEAERRDRLVQRGAVSRQSFEQARMEVRMARARKEGLQAQLAAVRADLADSALAAPFDGVVTARSVDEGAVVGVGQPVVRLLETGRPEARIGLPGTEAARLAVGDAVSLEWRGRPVEGEVRALVPEIVGATRTSTVVVTLPPTLDGAAGDVLELVLTDTEPLRGFWVPSDALVAGERGLWALQVARSEPDAAGEAVVRRAAVELLHTAQALSFVRGTLQPGDRLIVAGTHRVVPGQRVEVLASAVPPVAVRP